MTGENAHANARKPIKRRTERLDLPVPDILERYSRGESVKSIAASFGCARHVIGLRLKKHGITPRNRSEAMFNRMAHTPPEQRSDASAAAHAARRGQKDTDETGHARALWREKSLALAGDGELQFQTMLLTRGIETVHQRAVHRYNLDLSTSSVAVEISINTTMHPRRGDTKRIVYLRDHGWHVVYVTSKTVAGLTEVAADEVARFIEFAESNPSPLGHYRVVRGSGQLVT